MEENSILILDICKWVLIQTITDVRNFGTLLASEGNRKGRHSLVIIGKAFMTLSPGVFYLNHN